MTLGRELKLARKRAKLSQEELAHRAGLDRSNLSELESDKKSPNLETIFRIADALGISAGEMVSRIENERRQQQKRT